MLSCEYCETTDNFFYRTPLVASVDLLFSIKNTAGWFVLKRFTDLVRLRCLHIISRIHSNTLLLIILKKTKTCPTWSTAANAICSDIRILTVWIGFVYYLMSILMIYKQTFGFIYQVAFSFAANCYEKE